MAERQPQPNALEKLAEDLASLGAESPAERTVKRVAPWVLSLTIHIGVVALALLVTWSANQLPKKDESVLIVADFNALNYEPVASMRVTSQTPTSQQPFQDRVQTEPVEQIIRDAISRADVDQTLLMGSASSASSSLSQFAPQSNINGASFAGLSSTNARKIVYVIDASGSMIMHHQIVLDELARSLDNLSPQQSFSVIYFQANNAVEVPPVGRLISATAQNRSAALEWIKRNVVPAGGTNPLIAIEKALTLKPDVVFLLSQDITGYGQFEVDQQDLMKLLDGLNPKDTDTGRRKTQINCIQFVSEDRLKAMQAIAKEHGGPNGYKFLSSEELGLGLGTP
jgi:hypothetical protein